MIEKLYTVEEVAELASVTGRTIRNYLKSGRLVGRKIGGQWRFPESEVQRLLTGGEVPEIEDEVSSIVDDIDSTAFVSDTTSSYPTHPEHSYPSQGNQHKNMESAAIQSENHAIQHKPSAYTEYNATTPNHPSQIEDKFPVTTEYPSVQASPQHNRITESGLTYSDLSAENNPTYNQSAANRVAPIPPAQAPNMAIPPYSQAQTFPTDSYSPQIDHPSAKQQEGNISVYPTADHNQPTIPQYIPNQNVPPMYSQQQSPAPADTPLSNQYNPTQALYHSTGFKEDPPMKYYGDAPVAYNSPSPMQNLPHTQENPMAHTYSQNVNAQHFTGENPPNQSQSYSQGNPAPNNPQNGPVNYGIPFYGYDPAQMQGFPQLYAQPGQPPIYPGYPPYGYYPVPQMAPNAPAPRPTEDEEDEHEEELFERKKKKKLKSQSKKSDDDYTIDVEEEYQEKPAPESELEKVAEKIPATPEFSDVGKRVARFMAEVHECSNGPQTCSIVDLYQSLATAKATSERLSEIALQESENGQLCQCFVEFDERYFVARYTLFGSSEFLLRCLKLIG